MKRTIRTYSLLALLLLTASTRAQQFRTTDNASTASFGNTAYQSALLQSAQSGQYTSYAQPASVNWGSVTQGSVFSKGLFDRKRHNQSSGIGFAGTGYTASISAYQHITPESVGAPSVANRGGIAPPPPTPDPTDDDINKQLPVGDACWLLLLLAGAYGALRLRKKEA